MNSSTPIPRDPLIIINNLVDQGLFDIANAKIKEWGLANKIKIENGRIMELASGADAWLAKFITVDPQLTAMKDDVRKLAKETSVIEVLISGPTGTGKELIARALHGDREGRFIAANCGGMVETLIESTLFGHVKGSFTGAIATKPGLLSQAKNGTFFLDEVGELPLSAQAKFLRAIQERVVVKVGGDEEEPVNCNIVCATHRTLKDMISKDQFRRDLYARISTFELKLKPLSDRINDIIPIIAAMQGGREFLAAMQAKYVRSSLNFTQLIPHLVNEGLLDISLNVRSLQQHVKRYQVLQKLP